MRTISRISAGSLKPTALFSFGLLALFVQVGRAQDPLQFFKNYFVTGDYAVAGVGLYGQGINGFASNTLAMTGVPCTAGGPGPGTTLDAACATAGAIPAEPIAAFLIWQSIETTPSPSSANGWFRNWPITGSVAGNPQGLGCWSNGGTNPSGFLRVYIADVLRFLPFDETKGVRIANGAYTVKLVDSGKSNLKLLYPDDMPLYDKIRTIAKEIYGAADISAPKPVRDQLASFEAMGYGKVPVCIAKTQYSFSTNPDLKGAPDGHTIAVREVRLSAGAEFVVAICGEIMTMPGLPKVPAADSIDVNAEGKIVGLF